MRSDNQKIPHINILISFVFLFWIIAISSFILLYTALFRQVDIRFHDLPAGAMNGEWSAMAVYAGIGIPSNNINELTARSGYVIRAKIISKRTEQVNIGTPDYKIPYLYSIYKMEILDIFKGNLEVGDIIEISQRKKTSIPTENYSSEFRSYHTRYIRHPIDIDDDLILFLNFVSQFTSSGVVFSDLENIWVFNRIQGIYRYAPLDVRNEYNYWEFESINEHNNLHLTRCDLLQIRTFTD